MGKKIGLLAALSLVVCACGKEFTASPPRGDLIRGEAGEAGEAGAGEAGESFAGQAGEESEPGSSGGLGQTGGTGGSAGGSVAVGGGPSSQGGSSGSPSVGLGGTSGVPGVGGSSGSPSSGGLSGMAGSGGSVTPVNDPKYECSPPVNISSDQATACIKKVCSNLGYQCGVMGSGCYGSTTPCGIPWNMISCSDFVNSCPAYSGCEDHTCTNQCIHLKVTDPSTSSCNEPNDSGVLKGKATFRYQCLENPGLDCKRDTGPGAGSNTWCCGHNQSWCTVQSGMVESTPAYNCDGRNYQYTCDSSPNSTLCAPTGGGGYCCSSPNL